MNRARPVLTLGSPGLKKVTNKQKLITLIVKCDSLKTVSNAKFAVHAALKLASGVFFPFL